MGIQHKFYWFLKLCDLKKTSDETPQVCFTWDGLYEISLCIGSESEKAVRGGNKYGKNTLLDTGKIHKTHTLPQCFYTVLYKC